MTLVAIDLADDSGLEWDALDAVASTSIASTVAASAAEATTTPVGATRVVAAAAPSPGHKIGGGVNSSAAQLKALLMGDQLGVELSQGDSFHLVGDRCGDGVVVVTEAGEDVGNHLVVLKPAPRGGHLVREGLILE